MAHENYDVPHPFLGIPKSQKDRPAWHKCPKDKHRAIADAFVHFEMLDQLPASLVRTAPGES